MGVARGVISSTISGYKMRDYYLKGGTNPEVYIKGSFDIIMTGVGFLGPVGFGASSLYFLLDSGGYFGNFGIVD